MARLSSTGKCSECQNDTGASVENSFVTGLAAVGDMRRDVRCDGEIRCAIIDIDLAG